MTRKEFTEQVVKPRLAEIAIVLNNKAKEYANEESAFYNFEEAARIDNTTREKALWGMFLKHFISVKDLKDGKLELSEKVIKEKIGDAVNYLIILEGMLMEDLEDMRIVE